MNTSRNKTVPGRGRQRGNTVVEMAFAIPVLMTLLLGTIDFGWLFFVRHNMVNAAQTAARDMAVGGVSGEEAVARARGLLQFSPDLYTITAVESAADSGIDVTVSVSVPLGDVALFGFTSWFDETPILADVTLREEG